MCSFFDTVVNWPIGGSCDLRSLSRGCDWSLRNETKRNGRKQDIIGSSGGKLISFRYLLVSFVVGKIGRRVRLACCVRIEVRG